MSLTSPRKRIIVCCDGTWMDSDGQAQTPSNVTRLSRAIVPMGYDYTTKPPTPIPQIVFYQNGIGTGSKSWYHKYVGGATGDGMSLNIREVYAFLCVNYRKGDEIILAGFSRGAFTARSVASLIRAIGLLTPAGLGELPLLFDDWRSSYKEWRSKTPANPWTNATQLNLDRYRRRLLELEYTRPDIPIKCIAVWDTVGSLGVPPIFLFAQNPPTVFQLVNNYVEPNIEYAFQALALDESRRPYHPTIWEKLDDQGLPRVFKQTWFPGVHSDIGGSYTDTDLADITLAWMISQLDPLISFNHGFVTKEIRKNRERHGRKGRQPPEWGLGKIHNSMTPFFRLFGVKVRTPKEYQKIDPLTNKSKPSRLENTNEYIHSSVRIRMGRSGKGHNGGESYACPALAGWEFTGTETAPDTPIAKGAPGAAGRMKDVIWKKEVAFTNNKGKAEKRVLEMPEDILEGYERQLMAVLWPDCWEDFDKMVPAEHHSTIRSNTDPQDRKKSVSQLPNPSPKKSTVLNLVQLRSSTRARSPSRSETA